MKKIILLFFTFSGICCCFSQDHPKSIDTIATAPVANTLPLKIDSVKTKERQVARLYPNPARNKVEIEISRFEPGYVKLQLINNTGKIIREEKRLILSANETIVFMFSETPGLYYLVLKQGVQTIKNKLIIQ